MTLEVVKPDLRLPRTDAPRGGRHPGIAGRAPVVPLPDDGAQLDQGRTMC